MSKDVILSFVRTFLTAFGSFLMGKMILGTTITGDVWQGWVGGGLALASTIWGIVDKTATLDAIQSGLRSFVIALGGILIAMGKIKSETIDSILGLITPVVAFIYSTISKQKTSQIAIGKISATVTGKTVTKMVILVLSVGLATSAHSQSFFKPLPKPSSTQKKSLIVGATAAQYRNDFRPLVGVTASLGNGAQLAGGVGIGFQRNKFDDASQNWVTQYSVSGVVFLDTRAAIVGGIVLGLANGLIQLGPGYDFVTKQFVVLTGIGIKFN